MSGGSSSGSAAVVCAGLCPVALGVDGGGNKHHFNAFSLFSPLVPKILNVIGVI